MGKKIVDVTVVVRDATRAQHGLVVNFPLRFSSLFSSPGDRFCFPSSYNSQNAFFLLKFRMYGVVQDVLFMQMMIGYTFSFSE